MQKKWKWNWKTAELVKCGIPNLQCFDLIWILIQDRGRANTTMHTKRTLLLRTSSLEALLFLVWKVQHILNSLELHMLSSTLCSSSEFERSQRMTWLDFISNLGGLCGLCLGISFISVTELLYWFTIRLFRAVLDPAVWSKQNSKARHLPVHA